MAWRMRLWPFHSSTKKGEQRTTPQKAGRVKRFLKDTRGVAALLLLSLLGKETGALFLPLALLLVFWLGPFRRDDGRRWWVLLAVIAAGVAYGLLRLSALHAEAVPQSARDPGQLGRNQRH